MNYEIRYVRGHVEVYDQMGRFRFSADSEWEALEELGGDLLNMVVETACGKQTKAESLGFTEMAIARVCNYV